MVRSIKLLMIALEILGFLIEGGGSSRVVESAALRQKTNKKPKDPGSPPAWAIFVKKA